VTDDISGMKTQSSLMVCSYGSKTTP